MSDVSSLDPGMASIICMEVVPCIPTEIGKQSTTPCIVAAAVKVHLLNWICEVSLAPEPMYALKICLSLGAGDNKMSGIRKGKIIIQAREDVPKGDKTLPQSKILWLPQLDPNLPETWPCECIGYINCDDIAGASEMNVQVTAATLVRVLPAAIDSMEQLTGEFPKPPGPDLDVLENQNPETVRELAIRLRRLLAEPVMVGIGPANQSALSNKVPAQQYWTPSASIDFSRDAALLVHSPDHGAGKTLLVETLARKIGCESVHIIQIGPLIAKYGVQADLALETILHQIVLNAALQERSACIILDHFTSMLPPAMSGTSGSGDALSPVLGSIAAHLRLLIHSLCYSKSFPFPVKNRMYNIHGGSGHSISAPARLCLVAVATCPDDGWQSLPGNELDTATTIFNFSMASHYRLPPLTAKTRLSAFRRAMEAEGISLSPELQTRLPYLAASAIWAKGIHFQQTARRIRDKIDPRSSLASGENFAVASRHIQKTNSIRGPAVEFLASNEESETECFAAIGGNAEAKIALEEALAMSEKKQSLLSCFGMSPPTGVLLYGPPGTGKTLLAKALAKMLKGSSMTGGAFVSISSTDVARAEVGTGEKVLTSAFETARSNAPAVVFIDEFQALFTDRNQGASSRLTSTLLTLMDDCKAWGDLNRTQLENSEAKDDRVIVLAATNTPWMIDRAFLRPGRYDRIVHVGLPDESERTLIFKLYIGKMKTSFGHDEKQLSQVCGRLSNATEGYSGADLAAICRAAAVQCLVQNQNSIEEAHFSKALEDSSPSSSTDLVQRILKWTPQRN